VYVNVRGVVDWAPRFDTFTETVPAVVTDEWENVPEIDVTLVNVVGTGEPLTITTEPARFAVGAKKAVPVQTTAALAEPLAIVAGVKLANVGVYKPTTSSEVEPDDPTTPLVFAGGTMLLPPAIVTVVEPAVFAGAPPLEGVPVWVVGAP
jgi:hypothetical protein